MSESVSEPNAPIIILRLPFTAASSPMKLYLTDIVVLDCFSPLTLPKRESFSSTRCFKINPPNSTGPYTLVGTLKCDRSENRTFREPYAKFNAKQTNGSPPFLCLLNHCLGIPVTVCQSPRGQMLPRQTSRQRMICWRNWETGFDRREDDMYFRAWSCLVLICGD